MNLDLSIGLIAWLKHQNVTLVLTSYKKGLVFFLGKSCVSMKVDGALGACFKSGILHIGNHQGIVHMGLAGEKLKTDSFTLTGSCDLHEIEVDGDGRVLNIQTARNCIADKNEEYWRPDWVSESGFNCCHLNGLGLRDGALRYVTAMSMSDSAEGWKSKESQGVVVDTQSGEVLCSGLSMPHSPRWYRDTLWVIANGHFGRVVDGLFEPLVETAGFPRGITFAGDYAIICMSKWRQSTKSGADIIGGVCGLIVLNLNTFKAIHSAKFNCVEELFTPVLIPGFMAIDCPGRVSTGFRSSDANS